MKHLLPLLFFFLIILGLSSQCKAQFGINAALTHPRGDFGRVFKPTALFELNYHITEIDNPLRLSVSLGFMRLNTVQDTFQVFALTYSGNKTYLDSGYELYKNYYSIPLAFKSAYRFLETDLSPTAGIDVYIFFNDYEYEYNVTHVVNSSEVGGSTFFGYQGKIGLNYKLTEELNLDVDFGRTETWDQGEGSFTFWRTSIGLNYFIY